MFYTLHYSELLFSSYATFVASFSETPKAPDDACVDTIELACLQTFKLPTFIGSKYLNNDIVY